MHRKEFGGLVMLPRLAGFRGPKEWERGKGTEG